MKWFVTDCDIRSDIFALVSLLWHHYSDIGCVILLRNVKPVSVWKPASVQENWFQLVTVCDVTTNYHHCDIRTYISTVISDLISLLLKYRWVKFFLYNNYLLIMQSSCQKNQTTLVFWVRVLCNTRFHRHLKRYIESEMVSHIIIE